MKTGTCYFPTYGAACRYYRPQFPDYPFGFIAEGSRTKELRAFVDRKLNEGAIHIGKPALKPGETLTIEDNRYHVQEANRLIIWGSHADVNNGAWVHIGPYSKPRWTRRANDGWHLVSLEEGAHPDTAPEAIGCRAGGAA